MFLGPGLINFHDDAAPASHAASALTAGAVVLIIVAIVAVAATWRHRTGVGSAGTHPPRRGTSAILLGAICAVLLVLVSSSERQIPSLTIVSHASTPHPKGAASARRARLGGQVSAIKRLPAGASTGRFAVHTGRAQDRRRCPVTVHPVVRAARLASP